MSIALLSVLTGSDLLTRIKELGDASKSEMVRECGYVSTKKDGTERLNFTAFYEAILEAKGLHLGDNGRLGRPGRALSYITHVQFNGNLMVGKAYTQMIGLKPGDSFEIKLSKKNIRLVQMENETGDTEEDNENADAMSVEADLYDTTEDELEEEEDKYEDEEEETLEISDTLEETDEQSAWTDSSDEEDDTTQATWSEDQEDPDNQPMYAAA
jgi:hypothetical protein